MRVEGNGADTGKVMIIGRGIGLASDTLSQMLNPFCTTKSKGLGMGLPVSQPIIDAHGGRLWEADRGVAFYFTLSVMGVRSSGRSPS
jgi:C4-dicarboxylate-specific signal transduction histidine kinase